MLRLSVLAVSVALLGVPGSAAAQEQITGTMVRAVDGDTIEVRTDAGAVTVRLIGIDTPETKKPGTPVECGGLDATASMARWTGRPVTLTTDPSQDRTDRYGRLLAYGDVTGKDIGLEAVKDGHSDVYVYDDRAFARQPAYEAARDDARDGDWGAWNPESCAGDFHSPATPNDAQDTAAPLALRAESAEQFVRRHYFRLTGHRYSTAWAMLSASLRTRFGPYRAWRSGYRRTVGIRVNATAATLIGDGRAVVITRFRARDRDACTGGIRQQFFRARWVLTRQNGTWTATTVTARKVSGQRVRLSKSDCPKPKPKPARSPRPSSPSGGGGGGGGGCHPSYTPCVPNDRDYDCGELNGPYTVTGSDPYRLDGDNDGTGCE